MEYKHLSDFGVTTRLKETHKRGGKIPSFMLVNNNYIGKSLWYKKQLYTCVESTTNTVTINVSGELKRVHRREVLAPKETIPVYKQKTTKEILTEIQILYPDAKLHVPKVGCQLHGDIDAVLTVNGESYLIAWNY